MRRDRQSRAETPSAATLAAAAHALASFDPLRALKVVALGDAPAVLALRGVALAQLGDYAVARRLLQRAARGFAVSDAAPARARCLAALGEVALAHRDLDAAGAALDEAAALLSSRSRTALDTTNAAFVHLQRARRAILLAELDRASAILERLDLARLPPRLTALGELALADIAVRQLRPDRARRALARAGVAARAAGVPLLLEEHTRAVRELDAPVARLAGHAVEAGDATPGAVTLDDVVRLRRSAVLLVDGCRREIRRRERTLSLVTRPVLLALAIALGQAESVSRERLAEVAFDVRRINDSVRVRLRVEIGRLRRALAPFGDVIATSEGYALRPSGGVRVAVLLPPPGPGAVTEASELLALLRGGDSWSTSALATAIGSSQRTVQRELARLHEEGRIETTGRGRAQRWVARPPEGFATHLLLLAQDDSG